MTSRREIEALLTAVADQDLAPGDAADRLATLPFRDLGFARVDTHRELRQGAPEVILGAGKTPAQAAGIALALAEAGACIVQIDANDPSTWYSAAWMDDGTVDVSRSTDGSTWTLLWT